MGALRDHRGRRLLGAFGILALVFVFSESISTTVLMGVGVALLLLATVFTLFWITKRIAPLQGELHELQGGGGR